MAIQKSKSSINKSKIVSRGRSRGKIWVMAIDPFSDTDLTPLWNLVKPLADHAGAHIQAVYVLAPASFNWTGDFSGPWMKKYIPVAEAKLQEVLPGLEIDRVVLTCREAGQRGAVKTLHTFAQNKKADCIVIATHGRTGLERMALGSFAETVVLTSQVPVLVINPEQKLPQTVRKILVPVDLGRRNEKFVLSLIAYAKAQNAEIILFNKQDEPLDPIVQQGVYSLGGGWMSVQNFIDSEIEEKTKRIEKIEAVIRKHHIPVSHIFDSSPEGLVESIEQAALDTGADMVSVLTHSGNWSAALMGSVARSLVRHSPVPILVQR